MPSLIGYQLAGSVATITMDGRQGQRPVAADAADYAVFVLRDHAATA